MEGRLPLPHLLLPGCVGGRLPYPIPGRSAPPALPIAGGAISGQVAGGGWASYPGLSICCSYQGELQQGCRPCAGAAASRPL